jgi:hypothetical protein
VNDPRNVISEELDERLEEDAQRAAENYGLGKGSLKSSSRLNADLELEGELILNSTERSDNNQLSFDLRPRANLDDTGNKTCETKKKVKKSPTPLSTNRSRSGGST